MGAGTVPKTLDRCTEAYIHQDPHFHPGLGLTVAQQILSEHQSTESQRSAAPVNDCRNFGPSSSFHLSHF